MHTQVWVDIATQWIHKYRQTLLLYDCTRCLRLSFHTSQNIDPRQDVHRVIPLRFHLFAVCKLLCTSTVLLWIWIKNMLVWSGTTRLRTRDEDMCDSVYSNKLLPCIRNVIRRSIWQLRLNTYTVRSSVRLRNACDSMVWSRRTLLSTLQKVIKR